MNIETVLVVTTAIGTFAFALSGCLQAAANRMDMVGLLFMAAVTAVGGGTFRDLLLDVPVFWLSDSSFIVICIVATLITWFGGSKLTRLAVPLVWADTVGMALFAVLGAQKALALGFSWHVATTMGVFSACLGGIVRDIVANEVPLVFRREIYITAALAGAGCYAITVAFGWLPEQPALLIGAVVAFATRAFSLRFNLTLPTYNK